MGMSKEQAECVLCRAVATEKGSGYTPVGAGFVILPTKIKKGHKHRYQIVSMVHTLSPEEEDYAKTCIFYYMRQFQIDFVVLEPTHASVKDHWHRVASDLEFTSEDFELIENTERVEVAIRKAGETHRTLSDAEVAYLAGLIDGEGTISISKITGAGRSKKYTTLGYSLRPYMGIANTNLRLLNRIQNAVGGWITKRNVEGTFGHTKPCYYLTFPAMQMRWLLPLLAQKLVIKRQQANLALELLNITGPGISYADLPKEKLERLPYLYAKNKELNS